MDFGLKGKYALVGGGGRGIGKAIAKVLALEGVDVVIASRSKDQLEKSAKEIEDETGQRCIPMVLDVTKKDQVDRVVAAAADQLGGLHILVNSASLPGGSPGAVGPIETVNDDELMNDFDVKYVGALRCARTAIPILKEQGWGRIINISGGNARNAGNLSGGARNVSLVHLTKTLSNQVGRFGFVEMANDQPAETEAEGLLWGSGALAVGINMAHSFTETGWATRLTGVGGSGRVADLPLWRCRGPGGEARVPLEVVLPQSKQGELYEAGFAVLGCRPNEDVAHLAFAPTVYQPIAYEDDESTAAARLQTTVPCQVFSTHIAHYLLRFQRELGPGLDADQVREELGASLEAVLAIGNGELPAGAVEVEVEIDPERPSFYRLAVHLKVPASILGQEIGLGMELGRPR